MPQLIELCRLHLFVFSLPTILYSYCRKFTITSFYRNEFNRLHILLATLDNIFQLNWIWCESILCETFYGNRRVIIRILSEICKNGKIEKLIPKYYMSFVSNLFCLHQNSVLQLYFENSTCFFFHESEYFERLTESECEWQPTCQNKC